MWYQPPERMLAHCCQIRLVLVAPPWRKHTAPQPGSRRYKHPCQRHHQPDRTKFNMRAVVGTNHQSRLAHEAENAPILINLQRDISAGIAASCMYTYALPAPRFVGSRTCQSCNKWSNQCWAATDNHCDARGRKVCSTLPRRQTLLAK